MTYQTLIGKEGNIREIHLASGLQALTPDFRVSFVGLPTRRSPWIPDTHARNWIVLSPARFQLLLLAVGTAFGGYNSRNARARLSGWGWMVEHGSGRRREEHLCPWEKRW